MGDGEEQAANLCLDPGYFLCALWVRVACPDLADWLALEPAEGCSCWCRPVFSGMAVFGCLLPGAYRLTLGREGRILCRLELSFPPGACLWVALDPAEQTWAWRRAWFHCALNRPPDRW